MSVSQKMRCFFPLLMTVIAVSMSDFSAAAVAASLVSATSPVKVNSISLLVAESRDENGNIAPIRPENQKIIRFFEQNLNVHFDIKRYPLPRLVENVAAGDGLSFGLSKNSERLKVMRYSNPVFTDFIWLVVRSDSTLKYSSIEDLRGKSVGIVRGIRFGDSIDNKRNIVFKVEEDQPQTSSRLRKLLSGRMDVMLFNSRTANPKELEIELNHYLAEIKDGVDSTSTLSIKVLSTPFLTDDIHFTTGLQNDRNIIDQINTVIVKGRKSGDLPALWRPEQETSRTK